MDVETEKVVKKHEEGNESHYSVTSIFNSKVSSNKTRLECKSLIVATGALSIPTLGGSGFGYELASQFSMPLTERRAGLVPPVAAEQRDRDAGHLPSGRGQPDAGPSSSPDGGVSALGRAPRLWAGPGRAGAGDPGGRQDGG